ncbi:hypothetical protein OF376_00710 [Ureaplasma miroungigenitalium]|uniref:YlxR domain-containing protein n=1 Tax=Ureaplasma miroungigenitalium TaxID=1042321 RepID=A0ABT3BM48_9BACT|nr:hypothetical protein [Ureaplasma miroungigenitalium]MCV3728309.1 hypothetical protein [Ureaplasma miroungigenitalium]MCV3734114.1 hypothetical protein [Ureaplasma miroungigenitalium]
MAKFLNTSLRTCIISRQKHHPSKMLRFSIDQQKNLCFHDSLHRGYYIYITPDSNLEKIMRILIQRYNCNNMDEVLSFLTSYQKNLQSK